MKTYVMVFFFLLSMKKKKKLMDTNNQATEQPSYWFVHLWLCMKKITCVCVCVYLFYS